LFICLARPVSLDMQLQPNIGWDRSWLWKVPTGLSHPKAKTLAFRFANPNRAVQFKIAFEDGQRQHSKLVAV
ncbi:hypothetical protein B0H13DRAFT_1447216, partial [Mycena leptocephala]